MVGAWRTSAIMYGDFVNTDKTMGNVSRWHHVIVARTCLFLHSSIRLDIVIIRSEGRSGQTELSCHDPRPIYAVLPFRFLNSSIQPAALSFGTTLIVTKPSTISGFPLPSTLPRLIFFPTFINPPAAVSMYDSTLSIVYSCCSSHGSGKI